MITRTIPTSGRAVTPNRSGIELSATITIVMVEAYHSILAKRTTILDGRGMIYRINPTL